MQYYDERSMNKVGFSLEVSRHSFSHLYCLQWLYYCMRDCDFEWRIFRQNRKMLTREHKLVDVPITRRIKILTAVLSPITIGIWELSRLHP